MKTAPRLIPEPGLVIRVAELRELELPANTRGSLDDLIAELLALREYVGGFGIHADPQTQKGILPCAAPSAEQEASTGDASARVAYHRENGQYRAERRAAAERVLASTDDLLEFMTREPFAIRDRVALAVRWGVAMGLVKHASAPRGEQGRSVAEWAGWAAASSQNGKLVTSPTRTGHPRIGRSFLL